jgi:hypothetical protein
MRFRDFVEQTKDAVHTIAGELAGGRPLTPMLHFESPDSGVQIQAVDHRFFQSLDDRRDLVAGFVVPLVRERGTDKIAWTFTGDALTAYVDREDDRYEVVVATFVDAEHDETWVARLHRPPAGLPYVGEWRAWAADVDQEGPLLITPIQEAMR